MIDLVNDPQLGSDSAGSAFMPIYWFDGAHYNDAGYQLFAELVRANVSGLPLIPLTTVNIKNAPYFAKGDTQTVLAVVSIRTAPEQWNKESCFDYANLGCWRCWQTDRYGTSPGSTAINGTDDYVTTITAFNSTTSITLNDATPVNISGVSQYVTWGTNDAPAFESFNTDFQGVSGITLDIPAGNYLFGDKVNSTGLSPGIPGLIVQGAGTASTTLTGDQSGFGGFLTGSKGVCDVAFRPLGTATLTANASIGATSLFIPPADTAKFSLGQIALLTGVDLQGLAIRRIPPLSITSRFPASML